mmetsp:Transcript_68184/g.154319  ORF Transcript_68184/g.154319 Transcript_68184/m.154319 type:complete len:205 (-) Transcript_68184:46-660(-)
MQTHIRSQGSCGAGTGGMTAALRSQHQAEATDAAMAECTPAAIAEPRRGPTQKTHMSLQGSPFACQTLSTTAGPKERVGLIEQPVMGMSTEWPRNTESPMARHATTLLAAESGLTAVSSTVNINVKVPIISPMSAWDCVQPSATALVPRPPVQSLSLGYMTFRISAPQTDPMSCATTLAIAWGMLRCPAITRPKVTAQLIWPPL